MGANVKVLMALMGLEIGGAETHALELCKCLKARGAEIIVVSNGGVYVKELTEAGITHINAPLHNRHIKSLIKSYKIIRKTIIDYNIRIVHAHARIPAFLCRLMQKRLGFRFVTTAHWLFDTRFYLKLLTDWGQYSLAVSEDIKTYLVTKYDVNPENVVVTINGIDTDKFSKNIDFSGVAREFGFDSGKTRIVYISRMDESRSFAAHKLIEAAPAIKKAYPETEIVIVGGGDDLENVKARAKAVNTTLSERMIIITGGSTEINRFVASADIFVGVSRSALEAMAAEKPCIIAGNEGYIGIFNEEKLGIAMETNFCCRGCPRTDTETLTNDLLALLSMDEGERRALGAFGRETIKAHYSVGRMADDALKLYKMAAREKKANDVVISGYYGFGNHGDDVLLSSIVNNLKLLKPDVTITVLSKRPGDTKRMYGVDSINRIDIFRIMRLFRDTSLLISGGGTLIQDLTSTQSLLYYLYIINSAVKRRVKVMLYGNGIGPIKEKNRKRSAKLLQRVDVITVRDDASFAALKALGVNRPKTLVTADPAFCVKRRESDNTDEIRRKTGLAGKRYFAVSVRTWSYLSPEFERVMTDFCDYIGSAYGYTALFVPMQPQKDEEISKRILSQMKSEGVYLGVGYGISDILGIMEHAEFLIGMRLHSIIYALISYTPVIGLVYDPKVSGLLRSFEQPFAQDVKSPDLAELCRFADYIVSDRGSIVDSIRPHVESSERLSFLNASMAVDLLARDGF